MIHGKHLGWMVAAIAATALSGTAAAADDDAKSSHRWRIEVSEGANNDGTIRFVLTPAGGEMTAVEVPIKKGRSENDVAKDVRDGFVRALPAGQYTVEVDDGEKVAVSNNDPAPKFTIAVVASDVKGTRIKVKRR